MSTLIKQEVHEYWNKASCGTEFIKETKFSPKYFKAIEQFRYSIEPEIFSFAQFTRFRNQKVLEVGIGAGTDFVQWVRAGAVAYGIDLTQESLKNVEIRLAQENLKAHDVRVADAENLPYQDNMFDLVYSWGVIHHSPNTKKCLAEMVRVVKPGGIIKLMIYNRHSLFSFYQYLRWGLFKGKPFQSLTTILANHQESPGTKAYTQKEVISMIASLPVTIISLESKITNHDLLYYKSKPFQVLAYLAGCLGGWHHRGWFMSIELLKMENAQF